jgi:hypothetical protein
MVSASCPCSCWCSLQRHRLMRQPRRRAGVERDAALASANRVTEQRGRADPDLRRRGRVRRGARICGSHGTGYLREPPLPRVSRMWAPAAASTALESQREIWCGAPECGPPVLSAPRCGGVLRRSAAASSSSAATPSSASLRARQRGARDREHALAVEMPLRSARSTCTGGPCTPGSIPPRSVLAARPHDASARRRPLPPRARHGNPGPSVGERPCASGQPAARPAPDKGPAQAGAPE